MQIEDPYSLHFCAFHGREEINDLVNYATPEQLNRQDPYGNTALHIAAMLKNEKIVRLLMKHGCAVDIRNAEGWRPVDEIASCGQESLLKDVYRLFRDQVTENANCSFLKAKLRSVPDCIVNFRWEFRTWIPFVGRHLPSDDCKLYKKDNMLRLDTTLLDFRSRDWVRGNLTIIIDPSKPFSSRVCLLDHDHHSYQILDGAMVREGSDDWLNGTVGAALHMPLVRMHIDFNHMDYKAQTGLVAWRKEALVGKIGVYTVKTFSISRVKMTVKKRSEHLTKADVRFLTTLNSHIKKGTVSDAVKLVQDHSGSLGETHAETGSSVGDETRSPLVSWEEYSSWKLTEIDRYIGRKPILKLQSRDIKLFVSMTDEVDFEISHILDLFKCFSPLRKFSKLNDAVLSGLPPGFPVRIDVPVFPGITGRVTFNSIEPCEANRLTSSGFVFQDDLFKIPFGYLERELL